jgi:hypothetical protein
MKEVELKVLFRDNLKRTIDWYYKGSGSAFVRETFKRSCVCKLEVAVKEVRPLGRTIIVA